MTNNNYVALPNEDVIWHINVAFNCVGVEALDFINTILLNANY